MDAAEASRDSRWQAGDVFVFDFKETPLVFVAMWLAHGNNNTYLLPCGSPMVTTCKSSFTTIPLVFARGSPVHFIHCFHISPLTILWSRGSPVVATHKSLRIRSHLSSLTIMSSFVVWLAHGSYTHNSLVTLVPLISDTCHYWPS